MIKQFSKVGVSDAGDESGVFRQQGKGAELVAIDGDINR